MGKEIMANPLQHCSYCKQLNVRSGLEIKDFAVMGELIPCRLCSRCSKIFSEDAMDHMKKTIEDHKKGDS